MKIKVASTVKGKLAIPFVYGTYAANAEVEINDDQAKSPEIFNLIKHGLIEVENFVMSENFIEYKNVGKLSINFSWGQYVRSGQSFFVEKKHTQGEEFQTFIRTNAITRVTASKEKKQEAIVEKENRNNKTVKAKKSNKDIVSKLPESMKEVISKQIVTENVHIHQPKDTIEVEVTVDEAENTGIKFVDQEQKKEKINRLHKFIKDKNTENNV